MTKGDARFEDGAFKPLRLKAETAEDLPPISALLQDAVVPATEMKWDRKARCFALLANRFRWEDAEMAERLGLPFERVQTVLVVEGVLRVQTLGFDPRDRDTIVSLLSIAFEPGEDGAGRLVLTLAGDGAIGIDVECLDIRMADVTQPYRAISGKAPQHPDD